MAAILRAGEYLTMGEVSTITRISVDTLRYWRHLGRGPKSFRLGRRVVYDAADLKAWIDEQRQAG